MHKDIPQQAQLRNLLIALYPAVEARNAIAAYRRACRWPEGFWLADARRLHMTLFELVEVPEPRVAQVLDILGRRRMPQSDLRVRVPASAAGIHELQVQVPRALRDFRKAMGQALTAEGFVLQGGTRPHITLSYTFAAERTDGPAHDIPWVACEFFLVWSRKPPQFDDDEHEVLGRFAAQEPPQFRLFA